MSLKPSLTGGLFNCKKLKREEIGAYNRLSIYLLRLQLYVRFDCPGVWWHADYLMKT
jgi:hypothetical protein